MKYTVTPRRKRSLIVVKVETTQLRVREFSVANSLRKKEAAIPKSCASSAAVYPPFTHDCDPDLKKAARYLAWYWNYPITYVQETWGAHIAVDLDRRRISEMALVFMLCWLELPLVLQTGNVDFGKVGLFTLGRWYHDNQRRH